MQAKGSILLKEMSLSVYVCNLDELQSFNHKLV